MRTTGISHGLHVPGRGPRWRRHQLLHPWPSEVEKGCARTDWGPGLQVLFYLQNGGVLLVTFTNLGEISKSLPYSSFPVCPLPPP